MSERKKAVMYGAGNIGRGFIGELFYKSGYDVVFIDVNAAVVDAINQNGQYPVTYVTGTGMEDVTVSRVRAVNGTDTAAVAAEIAECDIMATAVGVNVLKYIAAPIAAGIALRHGRALNILLCENLIDAPKIFRSMVSQALGKDAGLLSNTGFVETSIGRMVPVMTEEMKRGNPLRVCVEPYASLPADRNGFVGTPPDIAGMTAYDGFEFYIRRKLYIHNMGHAAAAYMGALRGAEYIWQAIEIPDIRSIVRRAMMAAAEALSRVYSVPLNETEAYADDLLCRFGNRALGDTVARVGRDLDRKLSEYDRLAGALKLCCEQGINTLPVSIGIAAALSFEDGQPGRVSELLGNGDKAAVLREVCGLPDSAAADILCMDSLVKICLAR